MGTLESWGSSSFTWEEGKIYRRYHEHRLTRKTMLALFLVKKIKGKKLIGYDILTKTPLSLDYKSFGAQEFDAPASQKDIIKLIFVGDYKGRNFVLWNPKQDTGWGGYG